MTMLLEDLRLALKEICQAIGLSGNALTVIPLVVLGVALNVTSLSAIEYVRNDRHSCQGHTSLGSVGRTELKVVRTVVISTLKKIGDRERRLCPTRNRVRDHQMKSTQVELGLVPPTPAKGGGCDVEIIPGRRWKTAIASVTC
jgi:hypothetical protein